MLYNQPPEQLRSSDSASPPVPMISPLHPPAQAQLSSLSLLYLHPTHPFSPTTIQLRLPTTPWVFSNVSPRSPPSVLASARRSSSQPSVTTPSCRCPQATLSSSTLCTRNSIPTTTPQPTTSVCVAYRSRTLSPPCWKSQAD